MAADCKSAGLCPTEVSNPPLWHHHLQHCNTAGGEWTLALQAAGRMIVALLLIGGIAVSAFLYDGIGKVSRSLFLSCWRFFCGPHRARQASFTIGL